jgi:hypothetical protein
MTKIRVIINNNNNNNNNNNSESVVSVARDYIASNGGVMDELQKRWKEAFVVESR